MLEAIKEFFQQPETIAVLSTALSFLAANLVTLITFACKYIKLKNQEMKNKLESEEVIAKLTAEYNKKIEEFAQRVDTSLDKVEHAVIKKVNEKEQLRDDEIKRETLLLTQAIADTKKTLEADD